MGYVLLCIPNVLGTVFKSSTVFSGIFVAGMSMIENFEKIECNLEDYFDA